MRTRHAALAGIAALRGRHLVIVRYTPQHDVLDEWVFNSPDPDNSPVLFARDSAGAPDLLAHYSARTTWLLLCGRSCELNPYPR